MGHKHTRRTAADTQRVWRNIFVALFIFSAVVGLSAASIVAALDLPPTAETGGSAWTRGTVRNLLPGGIPGTRVDLGSQTPESPPGSDTTVFPNLSGLNVPIIVNEDGPIRFFGDVTIDGLTEVKNGLINGPVIGAAGTPTLSVTTGANPPSKTLTCNSSEELTKSNITPSNGSAVLNGITLVKGGTFPINEIQKIEVFANSTLLTSITNPVDNNIVASISPTYSVPVGTTQTLTLKTTMKNSITPLSATLALSLKTVSTTGATVTGLATPKTGNTFSVDRSGCGGGGGGGGAAPTISLTPAAITLPGSGSASMTASLTSTALNTNANAIETVSAKITNADEPTNTFTLQLIETGMSTGIFNRDITVSTATTDASSRTLHVGACGTTPTVQVDYPTSGTPTATRSADVTCPTQPDLIVQPINYSPVTLASGDTVTVTGAVKNNGSATPGSSWNSVLVVDGTVVGGGQATGPLAYGATETETWTWTATQGTHAVQVCSDQLNPGSVVESNNANNCSTSATITVSPKLTLDAASYTIGASEPTANIRLRGEQLTGGTQTVKVSSVTDAAGINVTLIHPVAMLSPDYIGTVDLSLLASNANQQRLQVNNCGADRITMVYPPSGTVQASDTATTQSQALNFRVDSSWSQGATLTSGTDKNVLQFQVRSCTSPLTLGALRFTKIGTVPNANINNFKLEKYNGSTWVNVFTNTHALLDDGTILLNFPGNPQTLGASLTTFRLRATINAQAGQTMRFLINSPSDVGIAQANSTSVNLPVSSNGRTMAYVEEETEDRPIALFGSFIPTANASFIQTAQAAGGVPTATHPVTIYDDLFVRGNSATEPGNVFIQGTVVLQGGIISSGASVNVLSDLNVNADAQVNGNVQVLGTLNSVFVTAAGRILGGQIGAFYMVGNSAASSTTGTKSVASQCGTGDILLSCTGQFSGTITSTAFDGSSMAGTTCTARGIQSVAASRTLNAQAVCFNPNGNAVSGSIGTVTNL